VSQHVAVCNDKDLWQPSHLGVTMVQIHMPSFWIFTKCRDEYSEEYFEINFRIAHTLKNVLLQYSFCCMCSCRKCCTQQAVMCWPCGGQTLWIWTAIFSAFKCNSCMEQIHAAWTVQRTWHQLLIGRLCLATHRPTHSHTSISMYVPCLYCLS